MLILIFLNQCFAPLKEQMTKEDVIEDVEDTVPEPVIMNEVTVKANKKNNIYIYI